MTPARMARTAMMRKAIFKDRMAVSFGEEADRSVLLEERELGGMALWRERATTFPWRGQAGSVK
jgi:hypothetical protein